MSLGQKFSFSPEILNLLSGQGEFFQSVAQACQANDLVLRGADPDAGVERTVAENGDIEVAFLYGIDDNADPEDGRIYLRDEFLFDSQQHLLGTRRRFQFNNKSDRPAWQNWLQQFQDSDLDPPEPLQQNFAEILARRFAGGPPWRSFDEKWMERLKSQSDFLQKSFGQAQEIGEELRFKVADPQTHYTLDYSGDDIQVNFSWVVDEDEDPTNGRLFLRQKFTLDAATQELKEFQQHWELPPDLAGQESWEKMLGPLNQGEAPALEEAQGFIRALLPVLHLTTPEDLRHLTEAISRRGQSSGISKDLPVGGERRKQEGEARTARVLEALEILQAMAQERLAQGVEKSRGWLYRGPGIDAETEAAHLKLLFEKARSAAKAGTASSGFAVLEGLEGNLVEVRLLRQILSDRLFQRVNDAAQERDEVVRHRHYLHLAREDFFEELPQTAVLLAQRFQNSRGVEPGFGEILALAEGRAPLSARVEYLLPHFFDQVSEPGPLAGMVAAGVLGPTVEFLGLKLLGRLGLPGRLVAGTFAVGSEAAAFTAGNGLVQSAFHDPREVFAHFGKDTAAAALLFGFLKLTHGAVDQLISRIVGTEAKLPPVLGFLAETLKHGAGVLSFWGAGYAARVLGWEEGRGGAAESFTEALALYVQGQFGFQVGNRITGGGLQGFLTRWRAGLAADQPLVELDEILEKLEQELREPELIPREPSPKILEEMEQREDKYQRELKEANIRAEEAEIHAIDLVTKLDASEKKLKVETDAHGFTRATLEVIRHRLQAAEEEVGWSGPAEDETLTGRAPAPTKVLPVKAEDPTEPPGIASWADEIKSPVGLPPEIPPEPKPKKP